MVAPDSAGAGTSGYGPNTEAARRSFSRCREHSGGIVAKRLADTYQPKLARWHKILNRAYSQRHGRAELFRKRANYMND